MGNFWCSMTILIVFDFLSPQLLCARQLINAWPPFTGHQKIKNAQDSSLSRKDLCGICMLCLNFHRGWFSWILGENRKAASSMFSTCITLIRRNNIITNIWWSIKITSLIRELRMHLLGNYMSGLSSWPSNYEW